MTGALRTVKNKLTGVLRSVKKILTRALRTVKNKLSGALRSVIIRLTGALRQVNFYRTVGDRPQISLYAIERDQGSPLSGVCPDSNLFFYV